MKPNSPPEALYTFTYPNLGYSILIVPLTPADRTKIKRRAREQHLSLRDFCQDEESDQLRWPNSSDVPPYV
jgi:hypothetical protein